MSSSYSIEWGVLSIRSAAATLDPTVIPASVKAQISMRIVPDQDLNTVTEALKVYLQTQFDGLGTTNELQVRRNLVFRRSKLNLSL